jgi:nitroreductase
MHHATAAQVSAALASRYATKKFDPSRTISPENWEALEQSLHLAPSSFGLQPWRVIVVANPAIRATLRAAAWNQPQVTDASHLLVCTAKRQILPADVEKFIAQTSSVRGVPAEKLAGYKGMISGFIASPGLDHTHWNTRQVYIALGFFMLAAANLGIDTCPLEGIDPAQFDATLKLADSGYTTVVACAAGYRAADDHTQPTKAPKVRYPRGEIVSHII